MPTVNIGITATVKQLEDFANELGYQEFVHSMVGTEIQTIPNPVNRQSFLQAYFKNMTVDELSKVKVRAIDNAIKSERELEKQAIRNSIDSAVAVTFKA